MVLAKLKPRSLLSNRHADCTKYSYDVRSQLTGDGTDTYGYDNAGNRNNSSQTITTGNRLDVDTDWDYSYDDEGNLTSKVSVAMPTVTWTYTWDVNNRLTAVVQSAGGNDLYEISYKYDVFGNRIEQTEDTDGDGGGASNVTTRFAWEGSTVLQDAWGNKTTPIGAENWNIWADLSSGNALQTRYVRGDEVDQLFSRVKSDGTVAWYLTDRMGSVRQMLDATGSLENTITYDGFGNVIAETDAAFGDRWKWTGREYNDYTGLQYNRARYYSSESGRWVSEDPIGFTAGDYNISRYVNNNVNLIADPSGLMWDDGVWRPISEVPIIGKPIAIPSRPKETFLPPWMTDPFNYPIIDEPEPPGTPPVIEHPPRTMPEHDVFEDMRRNGFPTTTVSSSWPRTRRLITTPFNPGPFPRDVPPHRWPSTKPQDVSWKKLLIKIGRDYVGPDIFQQTGINVNDLGVVKLLLPKPYKTNE